MLQSEVIYTQEDPVHDFEIEIINKQAFGPGRFARTAYLIREGGTHNLSLSFVAIHNKIVVGSVRMTHITIGTTPALFLGSLAVKIEWKNRGIGRSLMDRAMNAAKQGGHGLVILIGDKAYYSLFGFRTVSSSRIMMPAPVNPNRLLACELVSPLLEETSGQVRRAY